MFDKDQHQRDTDHLQLNEYEENNLELHSSRIMSEADVQWSDIKYMDIS